MLSDLRPVPVVSPILFLPVFCSFPPLAFLPMLRFGEGGATCFVVEFVVVVGVGPFVVAVVAIGVDVVGLCDFCSVDMLSRDCCLLVGVFGGSSSLP